MIEIVPAGVTGNCWTCCPSTGTSHSAFAVPAVLSTTRSSAPYQVSAVGRVMLGASVGLASTLMRSVCAVG